MRKYQRDAIKLARDLGLEVVDTSHGKHFTLHLRTAKGATFKHQLPHDMGTVRHWKNWAAQLRQRMLQT